MNIFRKRKVKKLQEEVSDTAQNASRELLREAGRTIPPDVVEELLTLTWYEKQDSTFFSLEITGETSLDAQVLLKTKVRHDDLSVDASIVEPAFTTYTVSLGAEDDPGPCRGLREVFMIRAGLPGPATEEMASFLVEIRDEMIRVFGFSHLEAEGRIFRRFEKFDLTCEGTQEFIFHRRSAEGWAKTICYGEESRMVEDKSQLEIRPWPVETGNYPTKMASIETIEFHATIEVRLLPPSEGGRKQSIAGHGFTCPVLMGDVGFDCRFVVPEDTTFEIGEEYEIDVEFLNPKLALPYIAEGVEIGLWEHKIIALGKVLRTSISEER